MNDLWTLFLSHMTIIHWFVVVTYVVVLIGVVLVNAWHQLIGGR